MNRTLKFVNFQKRASYIQSILLFIILATLNIPNYNAVDFDIHRNGDIKSPKFEQCKTNENELREESLNQNTQTTRLKEKQLFLSEGGW